MRFLDEYLIVFLSIKAGHSVMVLERNDRIGGLLQYGIPSMKMSKEVVQRRIDLMTQEGIQFQTGVKVGSAAYPANKLIEDYDAAVLCLGATWPRDINIPGLIFLLLLNCQLF